MALGFSKVLSHILPLFILLTTWGGKKAKGYYVCFTDEQIEAENSLDDFPQTTWLFFPHLLFLPQVPLLKSVNYFPEDSLLACN